MTLKLEYAAYEYLVPGAKICYTDNFDDPNLPGTMKTTIQI